MAKCCHGSPVYRQFVGTRNDYLATRSSATQTTARDIFYTGPCPAADPNDQTNMDSPICNGICGNICSGICGECGWCTCALPEPPVFGFWADYSALSLAAEAAFPLGDVVYSVGPVSKQSSTITLQQAGRYLAVWTINGTAQANIDALITLRRNGYGMAGSAANVIAAQGESLTAIGQLPFSAQAGDTLQLVTDSALAISGRPSATLSLARIC